MCSLPERTAWKREYFSPYAFKSSFLHRETEPSSLLLNPEHPKPIGRYTVTSHCLGSGTFATVHLALDTEEHRQVACKMIRTRKEDDMSKVSKESRILMALNHARRHLSTEFRVAHNIYLFQPNINAVYDVEQDGRNASVALSSTISVADSALS